MLSKNNYIVKKKEKKKRTLRKFTFIHEALNVDEWFDKSLKEGPLKCQNICIIIVMILFLCCITCNPLIHQTQKNCYFTEKKLKN